MSLYFLISSILGMEISILQKCEEKEINKYRFVCYLFILLIVLSIISFTYFFYMVLNSIYFGIIGSALFTFIFYSILRFSLITISPPEETGLSWKKIIFNGTNIFRILLFSMFTFVIITPFVALLFHRKFESLIRDQKNLQIVEYRMSKDEVKTKQIDVLQKEIENIVIEKQLLIEQGNSIKDNIEIELNKFKVKSLEKKISFLKTKRSLKESFLDEAMLREVNNYSNFILAGDIPFFRLSLIFKSPNSFFTCLILLFLFISIIPFYIYNLIKKEFNYSKYFKSEMIIQISLNYKVTEDEVKKYLKKNFDYDLIENECYLDSPFNRIVNSKNTTLRKDLSLFNYFESISK